MRKRKRVLIIGGVRVGECKYLDMGLDELERLEEFDGDGNVVMYDVGGGYLLGKLGLIRMVKSVKSKKKQICFIQRVSLEFKKDFLNGIVGQH